MRSWLSKKKSRLQGKRSLKNCKSSASENWKNVLKKNARNSNRRNSNSSTPNKQNSKDSKKEKPLQKSTKRKMMQEIDILKSIKHTSHIKLLETFQTAKHYLIVMELCPSGDLLNYVRKRRKLTEKNAKYLFKQIMQGIAYMHQIGIVHRDIKLDNILLDGHGNVKIGDFGVSRRVDQEELLFEQCGTPAYIAPEIVQEIGYKGFPVDIWVGGQVGVVVADRTVDFAQNLHAFDLLELALEAIRHVSHLFT